MISIEGLNKAAVLAALYNRSRPQGMGFMAYDPKPMTEADAEKLLEQTTLFDYLHGRVMKINLAGNIFNEGAYDRDNGAGAAAGVIEALRQGKGENAPEITSGHERGRAEAAENARRAMGEKSAFTDEDGIPVFRLGLAEVAPILGPKIAAALCAQEVADAE